MASQSTEQINVKGDEEVDGIPQNSTIKGNGTKSTNIILRAIQYHYGGRGYKKSEEQIKREEWLIPNLVRFNRWLAMPAAVIIQFCAGSLYAWSVFNKPIDLHIFGTSSANKSVVSFYIAVAFFGMSAATMGPWLERNGPKKACLLGTSIFFFGNLLTALALYLQQIWLVYIGYGVFCGFGLGLCYISPVSCLQKWYPDKRGLAAGFAVCGFGAGSIAIAKVQIPLIESVGLPLTFVVLGSTYFGLMVLSALILRTPPPNFVVNGMSMDQIKVGVQSPQDEKSSKVEVEVVPEPRRMTLIESLLSVDYKLMYVMFLSNAIFGLVAISRLSPMVTDIFQRSPDEASTVVSINGGFNLVGRLAFSILSDYIGRKNCYILMLTLQLIIVGCFPIITNTQTYPAFLATMWVLTACYGAGFGVIPGFLSDKFGAANIGAMHGIILTAWSIAGVGGGLIFTFVFNTIKEQEPDNQAHPYNINVYWIFAIIFIGWICIFIVGPTVLDSKFNEKVKGFFRRKIFRRSVNIE